MEFKTGAQSRLCELINPDTELRCVAKHYSLGMCRKHFRAYQKWGDAFHVSYGKGGKPTLNTPCTVIEAHTNKPCGEDSFYTYKICRNHYRRQKSLKWEKPLGSRPVGLKGWQKLYDRGMSFCYVCEKYLSMSAFARDSRSSSGVTSVCKPCYNLKRSKHYASMPLQDKKMYKENARIRANADRKANPKKHLERNRARRANMSNEEKAVESLRQRQHYQKNKARIAERQLAYYQANKKTYYKRNDLRRIRRKMIETDGHTTLELQTYWKSQGINPKRCTYCDAWHTKWANDWKSSVGDHVVPISKGGNDYLENLVPCCRSCNSSKGNRILYEEWVPPKERIAV